MGNMAEENYSFYSFPPYVLRNTTPDDLEASSQVELRIVIES